MRSSIYTAWLDPVFYAAAAVFAVSLFSLVYSMRRYVELKNADGFDENPAADPMSTTLPGFNGDDTIAVTPEQAAAPAPFVPEAPSDMPAPEPAAAPTTVPDFAQPAPASADSGSKAENFVRGIYEELADMDARLKNIEASTSKSRVNTDFTVKFLEDILSDLDALDKEKIKARIEYLLSDLKK